MAVLPTPIPQFKPGFQMLAGEDMNTIWTTLQALNAQGGGGGAFGLGTLLTGAKGNGITDDRPAIQTALNSVLAAGGGTLWIPPGTYNLASYTSGNNFLYLTNNGTPIPIRIIGLPGAKFITSLDSGPGTFQVMLTLEGNWQSPSIEGLWFLNNHGALTQMNTLAINLLGDGQNGVVDAQIKYCVFQNFSIAVQGVGTVSPFVFGNRWIYDHGHDSGVNSNTPNVGIWFQSNSTSGICSDITLACNYWSGCEADDISTNQQVYKRSMDGFCYGQARGWKVIGNTIHRCSFEGIAISRRGNFGAGVDDSSLSQYPIIIEGNHIDGERPTGTLMSSGTANAAYYAYGIRVDDHRASIRGNDVYEVIQPVISAPGITGVLSPTSYPTVTGENHEIVGNTFSTLSVPDVIDDMVYLLGCVNYKIADNRLIRPNRAAYSGTAKTVHCVHVQSGRGITIQGNEMLCLARRPMTLGTMTFSGIGWQATQDLTIGANDIKGLDYGLISEAGGLLGTIGSGLITIDGQNFIDVGLEYQRFSGGVSTANYLAESMCRVRQQRVRFSGITSTSHWWNIATLNGLGNACKVQLTSRGVINNIATRVVFGVSAGPWAGQASLGAWVEENGQYGGLSHLTGIKVRTGTGSDAPPLFLDIQLNNISDQTGTLGANPITTTNGESLVQIAFTGHLLNEGDEIDFSGATAVNGITISGRYIVHGVIDANNFNIIADNAATASGSGGGAAVAYTIPNWIDITLWTDDQNAFLNAKPTNADAVTPHSSFVLTPIPVMPTAGGGSGTVTSVGISAPAEFSVSNSPITSAGTLTLNKASQAANLVWASPDLATGQPSFRALTANDLPGSSASLVPDAPADQGTVHTLTASGGDDTATIQAAINAAASGDTIKFNDGTYHITNLTLKSGLLFKGNYPNCILQQTGTTQYMFSANPASTTNSNGITFYGFVIDGNGHSRGFDIQAGSLTANVANNILIRRIKFQNGGVFNADSDNWLALTFSQFVTVDWCQFAGGGGACCKGNGGVGWGNDNFAFRNNIFLNGYQCITMNAPTSPGNMRNTYIGYNYFTSAFRMVVEINGNQTQTMQNCLAEWNYLENWVANPPIQTGETEGFSIVVDGCSGTIVRNNYMLAGPGLQAANAGNGLGFSIEVSGGYNTPANTPQVLNNYLDGSSGGANKVAAAIQIYYNGSIIQENNMINHSNTLGYGNGAAGASNTPASSAGTTQVRNLSIPTMVQPIPKPACGPTGIAP